ncbi:fatty acid synthesis protein [Campylobacter concisus]|uniref:Fatty acid synthesis protein n=2 Tax=Campylobacter concisus TaxID=199 RepID=A0A1Y5MXS6_9BACT|nr:fatty acid synthesis protein [Campylobacter concisus]
MVVINVILGALVLSYAAAVIYIINFIYSKINYIIDYVNNLSIGSDRIVTTAISVLKSLGAWNAFCDVFSIFSPILLSFFIIYATKIGITVFRFVRETLVTFILAKL